MRFFLSDGLVPPLDLEGVTKLTSTKGTMDACNQLMKLLSVLNPEVTPIVLITVGSIELSLDTIGGKLPLSYVSEKRDKLRKKLVRKIMDPLHLLADYLWKYEGKLMIGTLIPLPGNVDIPTKEYRDLLFDAYEDCNDEIHDINRRFNNGRSFHLGVKFEKRNKAFSCRAGLFEGEKKLSENGKTLAKDRCSSIFREL